MVSVLIPRWFILIVVCDQPLLVILNRFPTGTAMVIITCWFLNLSLSVIAIPLSKNKVLSCCNTEKLIFSASKLASLMDLPLLMVTYLISKLSVLDCTILIFKLRTRTVSSFKNWNGSILNHLCS